MTRNPQTTPTSYKTEDKKSLENDKDKISRITYQRIASEDERVMIYVKDTFYIATSTFEYKPGVVIHSSKDLVHWERTGF